MKYRKLGKTGIKVSEVGLGTWEMSGDVYGKKDDRESIRAIYTALNEGVNFIDTAAGYGSGHAEEVIGKALKDTKYQSEIIVSTKIRPECGIYAPSPEKPIKGFYSPKYILKKTDESLRRLSRNQIDILFLHTWSKSWGQESEWYEALKRLKKQGKIRAFGISIPDEGIADANVHIEAGRVDVIQCVYNIFQQEPEYTLFPLARKHEVGTVASSPFSSGALIGNWTKNMTFPEGDWRGIWPKSVKDNWLEEQVDMAETVKEVVKSQKTPLSMIALRFVLMNQDVSSVIPGSANPKHVKLNVSATRMPQLSQKVVSTLKQLWVDQKIHGTYNGSI